MKLSTARIVCFNKRNKNKRGRRKTSNNNGMGAFTISNAGDQIVKRVTLPGIVLATGAGTVIPVLNIPSSDCQSAPASEWASFAARYQQYRVRAIRVTGKAIQPVQTTAVSHSVLYRGDYIGSAAPTTSAQVLSDENVKQVCTNKDFVDVVTWKKNPNARLWNPTSAAIPVANTFSWVAASPSTPVLTTATTYYAVSAEWEVEFRGSQ
jgi:hypothetical protein